MLNSYYIYPYDKNKILDDIHLSGHPPMRRREKKEFKLFFQFDDKIFIIFYKK